MSNLAILKFVKILFFPQFLSYLASIFSTNGFYHELPFLKIKWSSRESFPWVGVGRNERSQAIMIRVIRRQWAYIMSISPPCLGPLWSPRPSPTIPLANGFMSPEKVPSLVPWSQVCDSQTEGVWFKGWRESCIPRPWLCSESSGQPTSFLNLLTLFPN